MSRKSHNISSFFKPRNISTIVNTPKDTSTSSVEPEVTTTTSTVNFLNQAQAISDIPGSSKSDPAPVVRSAFHPDQNYQFPTTTVGNQKRSCQWQWFNKYPWLDYCAEKDHVICFVCKNQNTKENLQAERSKELVFLESGFRNWKKALVKFEKHQGSKCHRAATTHEIVIPQCGNVIQMTNENEKAKMEMNRRCFMEIIDALQFLARQGLALRGDDDEESNLIQYLQKRSKSFPELKEWLARKQSKFTSHDAQNEVLNIMANNVMRKLLEEVRGNYYSIMADEYTDVSNKEQLTFCLRWVTDDLDVIEKFLGFYEIPNISSVTIVSAIKDILTRYQLNLNMCRGQCYDGASNMLGKSSGVAVQLRNLQPLAVETHCHAHSLSLSVKDTTKHVKILRDTMGTAGEIILLVKYSPKREKVLGKLKDLVECDEEEVFNANGILKLSETRWTVRADCFKRVLDNYQYLMKLWEHCLENDIMQTDLKSRIIGVKKQMTTFDFFFGLNIGHRLFSHTDNLSRTLQAEKMSACDSKRNANLVITVLESMRNEESFNSLYDAIITKAQEYEFIKDPVTKRKRKAPNYSILKFVEGYSSNEPAYHPVTTHDHYRGIFYEALDTMIGSIRERFAQPSFTAYEHMEGLLLNSIQSLDTSGEEEYLRVHYSTEVDVGQLMMECDILRAIFKDEKPICFEEVVAHLRVLQQQRSLIPNITTICKLLLVNPATTATAERSFSLARRIKTWMRSKMLASRFNSLAILHSHKKLTDALNLQDVANEFTSKNESRKFIFGRF